MPRATTAKSDRGCNLILVLLAAACLPMSAACESQGFAPRGAAPRNATHPPGRLGRDVRSLYASFSSPKKLSEKFAQFSRNGDVLTREIRIRQGRLKGVVREFKNKKLGDVETFLGIPYAAPPVKALRFMPPGSPPTWKEVKVFDEFGPVCPQRPPDLTHEPFKTMNAGHFNRLKGLLPFLTNQDEDCLYLNIYAPMQGDGRVQQKHPVMVYVHGESFEWNSGNPYDGSVLASYGNVVVVTINFRLGILGFLRPGLSEHTVSNFGLLDQIAALQWIKDNVEEFGGDPSSVTLMGHGTGAACINFLMVSPVSMASQGLFHKAILMSGTALADWALTRNPLQFTIQVAEALNCPLVDKNDELSNCLRRKRLSEIMAVKIAAPEFQTSFGPIVDGSVVPNTPDQVMGIYQSLFARYDLLSGLTEWESYHALDPVSLTYGMLEGERNEFLRKYAYSRYEALPYFALATTLSEYLDWRKAIPPAKSAAEEHRDLVLDLLSDARFAAPVIQMALYHSKINPKSYLYVFRHKSKMGEFAGSEKSISGEEIAYAFGIPLLNEEGPLSHHKFALSEQLLSESVLTYFTNFAKTGNPNAPRRVEYLTQGPKEWHQYDVYWPEYDFSNQTFLALGIPPRVEHHYRSQMTRFWNEILPDLLNNPTKVKQQKPEVPSEEVKNFSRQNWPHHRKQSEDSTPWTYGVVRTSPGEHRPRTRPFGAEEEHPSSKQMDRPLEDVGTNARDGDANASAVPYFVAVSACLLAINVVVIGFYCYKKRRRSAKEDFRNFRRTVADDESLEQKTSRKTSCGDSAYSVVECSESGKTEERPGRLKRCLNGTTEGQVKVKKWIRQEIVEKYSKGRRDSEGSPTAPKKTSPKSDIVSETSSRVAALPKPILKNPRRICRSNEDLKTLPRKGVQKVSVGVDATPSTRGESVLKQTPIEITKSLDRGLLKIEPSEEDRESLRSSRRSRTSVSLQMLPTNGDLKCVASPEPEIIKLHPKSDFSKSSLQTFSPKNSEDINVTSRDSTLESISENSHVDPLENIQKRNFPKVLPDFPDSRAAMRLSFPQSSLLNAFESSRSKHNPPPPPPPRVSTLQRKDKHNSEGHPQDSKLTTFSSVDPETLQEKRPKGEVEEDSASEEKSDASSASVVRRVREGKEAGSGKRDRPSIVIQSRIGPRKQEAARKASPRKARVNLQEGEPEGPKARPSHVLDSKGASDKAPEKRAKSFRI